MAHKAQEIIDRIIAEKAGGNPVIASSIRTRLALNGIDLKRCAQGLEDAATLALLQAAAREMEVPL